MKNLLYRILSIVKVVALIVLVLVLNVMPVLASAMQRRVGGPIFVWYALALVVQLVSLVLLYRLYRKQEPSLLPTYSWKGLDWRLIGLAVILMRVWAVIGTQLVRFLLHQASTANDQAIMGFLSQANNQVLVFYTLFTISILGPIIEELVFRGFLLHYWFKKPFGWIPMCVSSLIFAIPHVTHLLEIIVYFPLGIILYRVFERRRNLHNSIMTHVMNNSFVSVLFLLLYLAGQL